VNATILIFDVIPLALGLVGFMVTLAFGPEIFRWFTRQLAAQRNRDTFASNDKELIVERKGKVVKMKNNDKSNSEREPASELVVTQ
jgi:hypothetical protein